jgi:hypothetical protein
MQRLLICVFRYHSWLESCIARFVSAGVSLCMTAGTHLTAAAWMMSRLADVSLLGSQAYPDTPQYYRSGSPFENVKRCTL